MSKKITITVDQDKFRKMVTELYSSYEQLLDVEEIQWADEVEKLHKYFSEIEPDEIS